MSKTLRAGLAWATPVKPDKLLAHVDAYAKVLPLLHALRLAHRFGKGPHAHITKLPAEIELAIEDLIIRSARGSYNYVWCDLRSNFACYESRCAPSQHFEDMSPLWDAAFDTTPTCETCTGYGVHGSPCEKKCTKKTAIPCGKCAVQLGHGRCERTCEAAYEEALEEVAVESDWYFDAHLESADRWTALITQSQSGEVVKVLRTHFGLEAYFAHTSVDRKATASWPEHSNYKWHGKDERKTTLCYLTLPKGLGPAGCFLPTDMEAEMEEPHVAAAQALDIDTDALQITSKQRRRFRKALRVLNLGVHQHSSQMHGVTVSSHKRPTDDTTKDAAKPTRSWPRLLLLVNSE
ncbi:hypothetical protein LTR53_009653 [Teratosphaeriaceae sp. CCFEE 6253]|nr:hypothetical protein LTR53_009653 [Teratosphaeriaceae sp. CCFEE 6253]